MTGAQKVFDLVHLVWRLASSRRGTQLSYLALLFTAQSIALCQPLVIGAILNATQELAASGLKALWPKLWPLLLLYFGMEVAFWVFHFPARVIERQLAFHIRLKFREELTLAVCELPVRWHRAHHSGETIDQVGKAATALHEFAGATFQLLYMVMRLIGPIVMLVTLSPIAAGSAFAITLLAVLIIFAFDKVLLKLYREINRQENTVAAAVQDYFTNITTVITLRLEQSVVAEVVRRSQRPFAALKKHYWVNETKWFLVSAIVAAMAASVLGAHAYFTLAAGGALLVGTFFKLFEYLRRVGGAFYEIAVLWGLTIRQAADVYGTLHIRQAHRALAQSAQAAELPNGWRTLEANNISFTYEDEKKRSHHLHDVSLRLERGKAIALVGPSGSGKSTLLGVLRGLHQPTSGELKCDGRSLPHGLSALAHATTLFPQEPEIFSDSVRFNVAFGFDTTDGAIREALQRACFAPVIERLPNGLDTNVSEKGVNLSGGERQRLALARGLFFADRSEVLLLDEATSNVDAVNEQAIYQMLKAQCSGRCLVATIHKLNLLQFFDVVYFIEDGRVVDHGSLQELKERSPGFRRLWEASQHAAQASSNQAA